MQRDAQTLFLDCPATAYKAVGVAEFGTGEEQSKEAA